MYVGRWFSAEETSGLKSLSPLSHPGEFLKLKELCPMRTQMKLSEGVSGGR